MIPVGTLCLIVNTLPKWQSLLGKECTVTGYGGPMPHQYFIDIPSAPVVRGKIWTGNDRSIRPIEPDMWIESEESTTYLEPMARV
jgi:hypothetical protein